jgi:hypothetical protein
MAKRKTDISVQYLFSEKSSTGTYSQSIRLSILLFMLRYCKIFRSSEIFRCVIVNKVQ